MRMACSAPSCVPLTPRRTLERAIPKGQCEVLIALGRPRRGKVPPLLGDVLASKRRRCPFQAQVTMAALTAIAASLRSPEPIAWLAMPRPVKRGPNRELWRAQLQRDNPRSGALLVRFLHVPCWGIDPAALRRGVDELFSSLVVGLGEALSMPTTGQLFAASIGNSSSSSSPSSPIVKACMNVFFTLMAECSQNCLPYEQHESDCLRKPVESAGA
eukprot:CAMPEP_0115403138 /NCGR_PEP_ID=MMETSP0271-20121206/16750_1 /TAXON_ID=71861 /ORGANISM="Scrippsiella trochoidea, Strain CCMP3099" /LENGTH=214 /DNA_ID=CAMNT_0002827077 /DNA_START=701 /DNA_END=1347 /DNA_ORIENTATION=+